MYVSGILWKTKQPVITVICHRHYKDVEMEVKAIYDGVELQKNWRMMGGVGRSKPFMEHELGNRKILDLEWKLSPTKCVALETTFIFIITSTHSIQQYTE